MILLWPLILTAAGVVAWSRRGELAGRGSGWFLAWTLAGFLMSFSLITGFTIGLLILPVAAVVVLGTAYRSPHLVEAAGFLAGLGATVLLVAALQL